MSDAIEVVVVVTMTVMVVVMAVVAVTLYLEPDDHPNLGHLHQRSPSTTLTFPSSVCTIVIIPITVASTVITISSVFSTSP